MESAARFWLEAGMISSARNPINVASPWRRIGAYFIDYFVFILPLLAIIALASWALSSFDISPFSDNAWLNQAIVILVLTLPVVLYFAGCEASRFQATVGKRLLNMSVVETSGRRATLKQTTLRAIVKFLPWEYFHTIMWHWEGWPTNPMPPTNRQILAMTVGWLVIGWFVVGLFVGSRRTPYDRVAGTVVKKKSTTPAAEGE